MPKIHILPDTLIGQIAAGEVVERPASVLKELLENSIDAGATRCEVTMEDGGRGLIGVRDNGCGMDRSDAALSILRHATSKIARVEDLSALRTFGFRGEALAAIASVSKCRLRTREADSDVGTQLVLEGGRQVSIASAGCPVGTEIEVRNLFFSTPARLHFLRQTKTELIHSITTLNAIALAHRKISFALRSDGKLICDYPADQSHRARIAAVFGSSEGWSEVLHANGPVTISGFIGDPGRTLSTRRHEFLFINKRHVHDSGIIHAVLEGYGTRLAPRSFPAFVLMIEIDPAIVDVNVHPRKLAVKFSNPGRVFAAVKSAISVALEQYQNQSAASFVPGEPSAENVEAAMQFTQHLAHAHQSLNFSREQTQIEISPPIPRQSGMHSMQPHIILYLANSYIIVREEGGIVFVDQHAAHERITYERLLAEFRARAPSVQQLLLPISFSCTADERILYEKNKPMLETVGFSFDAWSGGTLVITAAPSFLSIEQIEPLVRDLFHEPWTAPEPFLKMLACKSSVTFGMALTPAEQVRLLRDLAQTKNNSTCPHGRPTQIAVTMSELRRRFLRS